MKILAPWVLQGFGAAICFAGQALLVKRLTQIVSLPVILFFLFGMTFIGYAIWVKAGGFSLAITKEAILFLVIAGLCAIAGNYLDFAAIKSAPNPGYAGTLKASQIIIITLVAPFLFGSEFTLRKVMGVIITLCGIFLVSF